MDKEIIGLIVSTLMLSFFPIGLIWANWDNMMEFIKEKIYDISYIIWG